MKSFKFLLVLLCILLNTCKEEATKSITETNTQIINTTPSLEGTWELVSYYNYEDDKVKDSSKTSNNHRQVKMYTKNKMMWSKKRPADSTEWFAYGSYSLEGSILTEILEYGSRTMQPVMKTHDSFVYEITLDGHNFSQIEIDEDGHKIYSENYKRIE